jgi:hypothetical protein
VTVVIAGERAAWVALSRSVTLMVLGLPRSDGQG